jgi:hypothetical protein
MDVRAAIAISPAAEPDTYGAAGGEKEERI